MNGWKEGCRDEWREVGGGSERGREKEGEREREREIVFSRDAQHY